MGSRRRRYGFLRRKTDRGTPNGCVTMARATRRRRICVDEWSVSGVAINLCLKYGNVNFGGRCLRCTAEQRKQASKISDDCETLCPQENNFFGMESRSVLQSIFIHMRAILECSKRICVNLRACACVAVEICAGVHSFDH